MKESEKIVADLLDLIQTIAAGDFSARVDAFSYPSPFDALGLGLNMLGEEIQDFSIEEKKILQNLEDREEQFRSVVESAIDAILIIDNKGTIEVWNKAAQKLFGYTSAEVMGKEIHTIFAPKRYWEKIKTGFAEFKQTGKGPVIGKTLEIEGIHKNGDEIPLELSVSAIKRKSKWAAIGVIRDISERKRSQALQSALYKISEATNATADLNALFSIIHNSIRDLLPAENFYIALYDPEDEVFRFPYFADQEEKNPGPQKLGHGLTEYVFRTGKTLLVSPEVFLDLEKKGEISAVGPPSIDWLGAPIRVRGRIQGVMTIQSYVEGVRYSSEDKKLFGFITEQVAMAIQHKQDDDRIRTSLAEKELLLKEIHHRIKNNIQVISSLLNLQSTRAEDENVISLLNEAKSRIQSIGLIHEMLYKSKDLAKVDLSSYIQLLAEHIFSLHKTKRTRVGYNIDVEGVFLEMERALPCGLIISELISNSLKHGFPGDKKGDVSITMFADKGKKFTLVIQDNGIGIPAGWSIEKSQTLGMQLVSDLVLQLKGTLTLDNTQGMKVTIRF